MKAEAAPFENAWRLCRVPVTEVARLSCVATASMAAELIVGRLSPFAAVRKKQKFRTLEPDFTENYFRA